MGLWDHIWQHGYYFQLQYKNRLLAISTEMRASRLVYTKNILYDEIRILIHITYQDI